jgi:hypothetical protein
MILELPRNALKSTHIVSSQNYILVKMVFKRYHIGLIEESRMNSRAIAELVLHLRRILSGEGFVEGLTAAQWAVLRYFAQANRFLRTPSAFVAFHATTRGTASQTIKSVETQGYLTPMRSDDENMGTRFPAAGRVLSSLKLFLETGNALNAADCESAKHETKEGGA